MELGAKFKSVHARHLHIEKYRIVATEGGQGQCRRAALGKVGFAKHAFQRECHGFAADEVIIHGQQSEGWVTQQVRAQARDTEARQQVHSAGHGAECGSGQVAGLVGELLDEAINGSGKLPHGEEFGMASGAFQRVQFAAEFLEQVVAQGRFRRRVDLGEQGTQLGQQSGGLGVKQFDGVWPGGRGGGFRHGCGGREVGAGVEGLQEATQGGFLGAQLFFGNDWADSRPGVFAEELGDVFADDESPGQGECTQPEKDAEVIRRWRWRRRRAFGLTAGFAQKGAFKGDDFCLGFGDVGFGDGVVGGGGAGEIFLQHFRVRVGGVERGSRAEEAEQEQEQESA